MSKRFFNAEYEGIQARIDTEPNRVPMVDICQVQEMVKERFGLEGGSAYIQLWRKTATAPVQIQTFSKLKALPNEYFVEEGGLSLIVQLLPPPPSSRHSRSADTDIYLTATRRILYERVDIDLNKAVPPVDTFIDGKGFFHSGLEERLMDSKRLYCTSSTIDLWNAMDNMRRGLVVFGLPGVEKSFTAWLWASYQHSVNHKSVLWVHVALGFSPLFLLLNKSGAFNLTNANADFVASCQADIVVLEGVVDNDPEMLDLEVSLWQWRLNPHRKALLVATSPLERNLTEYLHLHIDIHSLLKS